MERYLFSIDSVPSHIDNIYKDRISEFVLMCTPLSMNGIHLLTQKSVSVFDKCNGDFSIKKIVELTGYDQEYVLGVINALWQGRLIKINGELSAQIKQKNSTRQIDVWFHITNQCNLTCPYCYIKKSNEMMSEIVAHQAIDNLANSALSHSMSEVRLKFTGGEPLLRFPFIKDLVDYSKRWRNKGVNFSFHILTNGTLLSRQIIEYLKKENITISLSMDGIGENHDKLRHFKDGTGSFHRVVKAIHLLRKYDIRPYILTTVTNFNIDGLPELTQYLLNEKLHFRFSLYRELGASERLLKSYNANIIEVLNRCYDICEVNLPEEDFSSIHQFCDIKLKKSRKRACGIGTKGVSIGHRGEIAICQTLFHEPVGHVNKDDSLLAIRHQKQFQADKYSIDDYEYCQNCIWRHNCAGGCPMLTKLQYERFDTHSPYCDVFKACIPRMIKIMGMQILAKYLNKKGGENEDWGT